ncbi:hypothetical protein COU13_00520 [Candidatus Kaiserbacteria bacterium CG10_big_fil_rev_8_21_14_0_10_43_70]|uniref:Uncharacterized protein n=1 Tax=Candidatus Kaiserbacteria bacterium CG10_big_fil_rev_8_21_14_0_10_43_70 TaxID=1974605 RepID=A0A2H0UJC7_9BACT|nr:MAG: hypothetical protein COU13_00520 [Candidatus Kaiserbacteria bacterium CG10_big_fil_rev_8_21_14_0_10_43_70]
MRERNEEEHEELIERTYRITRENNQMLHSMRRSAFLGGIIKLIVWIALLGFPIWLYIQYVNPVLTNLVSAVGEVQQVGNDIGVQFEGVGDFFGQFKNIELPSFNEGE